MNPVQHEIINIYKEFSIFCKKNHLSFFAIGGTAIGTIRHKGFIPWDDDIDVAMPMEDFLFLSNNWNILNSKKYVLRNSTKIEHSPYVFNKIHNIETTMIEKVELYHIDDYKGVFIDVMPLCGIENTYIKSKIKMMINEIVLKIYRKSRIDYSTCKSLIGKVIWVLLYPFRFIFPNNFWYTIWLKLAKSKYLYESKYTGYLWHEYYNPNLIFKTSWFKSYIEMPFEDTTMRMPVGYHEMLTRQFGDYMKLPPEEERVNHGGGIIDLERPYSFYVEEYKKKGSLKEYLK